MGSYALETLSNIVSYFYLWSNLWNKLIFLKLLDSVGPPTHQPMKIFSVHIYSMVIGYARYILALISTWRLLDRNQYFLFLPNVFFELFIDIILSNWQNYKVKCIFHSSFYLKYLFLIKKLTFNVMKKKTNYFWNTNTFQIFLFVLLLFFFFSKLFEIKFPIRIIGNLWFLFF